MTSNKESLVIFHNPRCSKSRSALALLQEKGLAPTVVEYLKTPPTPAELQTLLKQLNLPPEALVRKGEALYKELFQDRAMTEEQWIAALVEHPVLMERPIVIKGARAVIGRPPERVLELLD